MRRFVLLVVFAGLMNISTALAQNKIMQPGVQFHGIRDYREVMPGALYRGGANNGRGQLNQNELDALCDQGLGTAYYLYSTGFETLSGAGARASPLHARFLRSSLENA